MGLLGSLFTPGGICRVQEAVKCHQHHQECLALVLAGKNTHQKHHGTTTSFPQAPKAAWKDVPCADLDMLIILTALPQAVLLFGKVGQDLLNIDPS